MIKIDAHQHFWQFDPIRDDWIEESMQVIRKDFLPEDLKPILDKNGISACVAVQADQSEIETEFLLNLATENTFIKGVVGWVDLLDKRVGERLAYYSENNLFKGVRHIAQGEADDFLLRSDFQAGIRQLAQYGLTYDILVYAHQLTAATSLIQQFPNQRFVLDHIAKPQISEGIKEQWIVDIRALAQYPNVSCKLSGMVTETGDFQWVQKEFLPFLEQVVYAFGIDRVMYGSDWPVCLLAASYEQQLAIVENYIATFSTTEQAKIMGGNAINFYNLSKAEI